MNLEQFNYDLPESLIAQTPLEDRTSSRLMTVNHGTSRIEHDQFSRLHHYLRPGDVLVLNDTKVLPARLYGVKLDTGAKVEILLLSNQTGDVWETLVKPAKRLRKGNVMAFGEDEAGRPVLTAEVMEERELGGRIVKFYYNGIFLELLNRLGTMPLPPYIKQQLKDQDRYQTVYAAAAGSAAAPTAGLHFTKEYLRKLADDGIILTYVTLHVGLGTFRPVSVDTVEDHHMHAEYYAVPERTAAIIRAARSDGRRIIAIGTTSARTLEAAAQRYPDTGIQACSGWTDIFIYPGYSFRIVNALLTNFHLPKSTLLMLVSALAGKDLILQAYREAVREEYRFYSFGDAMFIYTS